MTFKKEAELMNAIIVYCHRCHDEGDFSALTEMGFGPREMKLLIRYPGPIDTTCSH